MASEPLRPPSHCCRWPGAPRSDGAPRPLPRSCPECRRRSCRNWLVVGFLLVSPFPPSFLPPSLSCREVPWKVLVLRKYQGQIKGRSTVWVSKPSSSQFIRKCFGERTPFDWLVLALSPPFVHLIEGSPVTSYQPLAALSLCLLSIGLFLHPIDNNNGNNDNQDNGNENNNRKKTRQRQWQQR